MDSSRGKFAGVHSGFVSLSRWEVSTAAFHSSGHIGGGGAKSHSWHGTATVGAKVYCLPSGTVANSLLLVYDTAAGSLTSVELASHLPAAAFPHPTTQPLARSKTP